MVISQPVQCQWGYQFPLKIEGWRSLKEVFYKPSQCVLYKLHQCSKNIICSTSLFSCLFSVELSVMCLIHMSLDSNFLLEYVFFTSQWMIWSKGKLWLHCHPKYYLALLQHFVYFRAFSLPSYHFSCLICLIYKDLSHFLPVLSVIILP